MIDFSVLETTAKDHSNWVGLGVGSGVAILAYTQTDSIATSLLIGIGGGVASKFAYAKYMQTEKM